MFDFQRKLKALTPGGVIVLMFLFITKPLPAEKVCLGELIAEYFRDRGNDLLDIFRLRLSAVRQAKGFGFQARATCLAQVGALYFEGEHFGLDRRAIGVWREQRFCGGLSAIYFTDVITDIVYGNRFTDIDDNWSQVMDRGIVRNNVYWDDGRHHPFSVGGEVQATFLGLDIGLYPEELFDFAVGIFTLDPWDDDLMRIERLRPPPEQKKTEEELLEEALPQTEELKTESPKQLIPPEEEAPQNPEK